MLRARRRDRLGPARAGAVRARDRNAGPAEGLREGRSRHVAGIAIPDRLASGDELDVLPLEARVVERGVGRVACRTRRSSVPTFPTGASPRRAPRFFLRPRPHWLEGRGSIDPGSRLIRRQCYGTAPSGATEERKRAGRRCSGDRPLDDQARPLAWRGASLSRAGRERGSERRRSGLERSLRELRSAARCGGGVQDVFRVRRDAVLVEIEPLQLAFRRHAQDAHRIDGVEHRERRRRTSRRRPIALPIACAISTVDSAAVEEPGERRRVVRRRAGRSRRTAREANRPRRACPRCRRCRAPGPRRSGRRCAGTRAGPTATHDDDAARSRRAGSRPIGDTQ